MTQLPPLATTDALAALIPGGLKPGDSARAEALLNHASNRIRHTAGLTWVDSEGEITAPGVIVDLCATVAKRAFLNPGGYTSESVGDWSGTRPSDPGMATGVYLTAEEQKLVRNAAGKTGLGTIPLARYPEAPAESTYVDVTPPGKPLPIGDLPTW